MKKIVLYFVLFLVASGCGQQEGPTEKEVVQAPRKQDSATIATPPIVVSPPPVDVKHELQLLNKKLKAIEAQPEHITAAAGKVSVVKGKQGTRVLVVPKELVFANGQPVTGEIDVELREMPGLEQMIANGVQTVSDSRLLVSGGAVYVNMTSEGRQLNLKMGKSLKVSLPKQTDDKMELFYGKKDSNGSMNWTATGQEFRDFDIDSSAFLFANAGFNGKQNAGAFVCTMSFANDTLWRKQLARYEVLAALFGDLPVKGKVTESQIGSGIKQYGKIARGVYNEIAVQQFGWINCDRFLESQKLTTIACDFRPQDSISFAKVYLVFKDIKSVMEEKYIYTSGARFVNIPSGMKATMIAVAMRRGRLYSSRADVEIGTQKMAMLPMKATSEKEIAGLFKL